MCSQIQKKQNLYSKIFSNGKLFTSPKILVVEDNDINIKVIQYMLLDIKISNVTIAKTAKDALRLLSPHYDLVILDIGLPDMNGIDLCMNMRKLLSNNSIPIIAYTACGDSIKHQCFKAGFNDFINKPTSFTDFQAKLSRWLAQN